MSTAPTNEVATDALPQAKPPFLRRVRIRGYKSIVFCDVTLEPLTILVGRNASGKSNFLDALAFLRDMLHDGLNPALENHGGMSLFSQELKTNRLMFEIESEFPGYRMLCQATYRVELSLSARKQLEVEQEFLQLNDITHGRSCGFTAGRGHVSWQGLESFQETGFRRIPAEEHPQVDVSESNYPSLFASYRPDRLLLGVIGSQPFIDLAEGIRSAGFYNFNPDAIREPQPSVGSPALWRDGRNLARAIEGLREIEEGDAVEECSGAAWLDTQLRGHQGTKVQEDGGCGSIRPRDGPSGVPRQRAFFRQTLPRTSSQATITGGCSGADRGRRLSDNTTITAGPTRRRTLVGH
jgi:predicted ATPase